VFKPHWLFRLRQQEKCLLFPSLLPQRQERPLRREQLRDRVRPVNACWPGQLRWRRYLPTIETELLAMAASLSIIYHLY
jgi:hypothetical protein